MSIELVLCSVYWTETKVLVDLLEQRPNVENLMIEGDEDVAQEGYSEDKGALIGEMNILSPELPFDKR